MNDKKTREKWLAKRTVVAIGESPIPPKDPSQHDGVTMGEKVQHVLQAPQKRRHHCHWPNCEKQVPPAMWGCRDHWKALPANLRRKIWRAYVPGQEDRGDPSEKYIEVAQEVQAWIAALPAEE